MSTLEDTMHSWGTNTYGMISTAYGPAQAVADLRTEISHIATEMADLEADLGTLDIKPLVEPFLGWEGEKEIVVRPEGITLNVHMNIQMDAEQLAHTMWKANSPTVDGYFVREDAAKIEYPEGD